MSGLRFKVGDLAVLAIARTPYSAKFLNEECEIVQVGPWKAGTVCPGGGALPMDADYVVMFAALDPAIVADHQLRRISPSATPARLGAAEVAECNA
jgi:hypothetical protein